MSSTGASCHAAAPPAAIAPATSGAAHRRGGDSSSAASTTPAAAANAGVTTPLGWSHHPHDATPNTTTATTSAGRVARTVRSARPSSVALEMTSTNASSGPGASNRRYQARAVWRDLVVLAGSRGADEYGLRPCSSVRTERAVRAIGEEEVATGPAGSTGPVAIGGKAGTHPRQCQVGAA